MLCDHVMSAWVVYGLATWPYSTFENRRYVFSPHHWPLHWPSNDDERDGPLLVPFGSGFFSHTHTCCFPWCCVVTWNVVLKCLWCCVAFFNIKTKEVSRRSAQVPLKKADKSKPLHQSFRLFGKQPTTDKKVDNGKVLLCLSTGLWHGTWCSNLSWWVVDVTQ